MKYQLNPDSPWLSNGTPFDNGDGTFSYPVIINPQIVDDTYGFIAPSPQKNMFNAILPGKGKDYDAMKKEILVQAEAWCVKQYPDT